MGNLWDDVSDFVDRNTYVEALIIIVTFMVLAKVVDWVLSGFVRRLASRSDTEFDDNLLKIMHRPIFTTVALIGLILATYSLELNPDVESNTVLIVRTILVIIWLIFGLRLSRLLMGAMQRSDERFPLVQPGTEPLFKNMAAIVFFLIAVYAILLVWGISVSGLVASAGIVGLALSFAAQDTLSNLFAGAAILADKPYEIDDFIILDSGERGKVTHIGLRSTRLVTRDDVEVSIPNSVMGRTKTVNEAGGPPSQFRTRISVGVAYGSDIDQVIEVLQWVADHHPKALPTPEPRVRLRGFGDSSLDFELLWWIEDPADRGVVTHEINCEIYRRFADAGISIPFPQRDLHIKEMPSQAP